MHNIKLIGALTVMLGLPTSAWAQTATTGAIAGTVRDKDDGSALNGTTVVVTSTALQGPQTAMSEGEGQFKITNLPPGSYTVTFYYSDITVRKTNQLVKLNKTTPVHVKIDTKQSGGEVITITTKAPSIDPTSTNQGVSLDQDYTRNIPVPGRTFESALGAAPGSAGDQMGVSFSGSTSLENAYVVDGVNTTGLTYGTVGSPLINDFIEEIEIITGGYNAEYGRSTGGVVNVITKSGSNEFHGSVFSYVTPGFLVKQAERNPSEGTSIDATGNLAYAADFGFELGGPIVKDKVWFYVGFAPTVSQVDITKITRRRTDCKEVMENGLLSACDPEAFQDGNADRDPDTGFLLYEELDRSNKENVRTSYQFVTKVNFALSPEHQGQVTLTGTPASGEVHLVRGEPNATAFDYTELTTDLSAKWTSKFNNNDTEVEALLGWHRSTYEQDAAVNAVNTDPRQTLLYGHLGVWGSGGRESDQTVQGCSDSAAAGDPYPLIPNCPDDGYGYAIGGPGGIADNKEERLAGKVSLTQRIKAAGSQEVKAGVDVEENRLDDVRNISGGVAYTLDQRGAYYATRWIRLAAEDNMEPQFADTCRDRDTMREFRCEFLGPDTVQGRTLNWSGYARDSWQVMPNITLNYGLRYEEQRLRYAKNLQGTIAPLTGDLLGTNAMVIKEMWAPRFGALYDWTKEGRSKVYGHWGRFYESIPMDINDRSFGGETLYRQVYDPASQCGDDTVPNIGGPSGPACSEQGEQPSIDETIFGSGTLVAPGIKGQYLDESIIGVEYEVMEDVTVGVSYQNRRLGRVLEDVSVDQAATYILANPGEFDADEEAALNSEIAELKAMGGDEAEIARLEGQRDSYVAIRDFDKPRRDYNALQLTATKRFSRNFFAQASYTYSRTQGNYGGLFSADNGQVDPNITSQYDLIELLSNRDGPLPQDRPHYVKLDSYYRMDFKKAGLLTTGVRFRALSGTPTNALARHYLYGRRESFLLPRGASGRTPFDYGLDLRMTYGRDLKQGMHVELFFDVFSVFDRQTTAGVDQEYTTDRVNPVVGGDLTDLVYAKAQNTSGGETSESVSRKTNFGNTTSRYSPISGRFGLRLRF